MKAAKLIVLTFALALVACGQSTASSSTVKDDSGTDGQSDDVNVSAFAATSLPGKPQAVGFRVATDSSSQNYLVRIAPGSPVLSVSIWTTGATPSTVRLKRQDPCKSSSSGWTCQYLSDDGLTGFTVKYRTSAPDTFQVKSVLQDGVAVSDDDILPPPNPVNAAATGCDPTDPLSCSWFQ